MTQPQQNQPVIRSEWVSDDDTEHRLEAALADIKTPNGLVHGLAIRNNSQPQQVLVCTPTEAQRFAQSAQHGGAIGKMLQSAGTSGASSR